MASKYSLASKARWAKIPADERSRIMRERSLQNIAKKTPDEMKAHIKMMVEARKRKVKSV